MARERKNSLRREIESMPLEKSCMDSVVNGGVECIRGQLCNGTLDVILVFVTGPMCDLLAPVLQQMKQACLDGLASQEIPKPEEPKRV